MEAEGRAVHGEADFLDPYPGDHVLDAGCGAGRVAAELARRGRTVVGADNDADMLDLAGQKPEQIRWVLGDLSAVQLGQQFDLIVMAGNILNFAEPSLRPTVVANLNAHLVPDGLLISGANDGNGCSFAAVDEWHAAAGMTKVEEFAAWDRTPFERGDYRVVVHRSSSVLT